MLTEPICRTVAAGVVTALHALGQTVVEITVEPNGSGVSIRVALDQIGGPVVEARVPPGYFSYDQVADALVQASGRCIMPDS